MFVKALASVHPGHTVAEVVENTGFAFDRGEDVPTTPAPSREDLRILRTAVAPELVLPDLDGNLHSLAEQRGKKVLLYCWASW